MTIERPIPDVPPVGLAALDRRSRDIFRRIVDGYLATGEPLGSRNLSRLLSVSLSPASVRNVMADLEALGLIYAPHVSAGRLPTELGLRFFVDAMLEIGDLSPDDRSAIERQISGANHPRSMEEILTDASGLLSGLSRGAGVVVASKQDPSIKHIEFVPLEPGRALAVLVGGDGSVENRLVALPAGLPSSALIEASNFLNARMRGRTLAEARSAVEEALAAAESEIDVLSARVVEAGLASWAGGGGEQPRQLIVRGQANLLEDLKALEDLERVRLLLDDLESKKDVIELLGRAESADGVRIFIGSENKLFSLSGSSMIAAPFRDGEKKIVGVLGVIGPTRLNYARIVPMVDYTARVVGRLIGQG
ncbi:heat-inducible transcriptional repressor HrcA [Hansschlegelia zhihuaiae]|uniref:Heat-inducible transcription repressor HrcA n=1 Tax=Hansschlegelia zhihuaiae TaxID=405005 RepID=A0A4Q0MP85_9HYPH|nr:heat-inducible transcriptional repressor HrcA [Hansschlegelia zhihuaiae]RXF75707.1 heat-inducible transcriptional repressor HrcA [Hansschlegelia zhihuaiae]